MAAEGIVETNSNAAATETAAAASSSSTTPAPVEKKEYTECEIQVRMTNGQVLKANFKPSDTIQTVRDYVNKNRSDGSSVFKLMTNFPKKVYESLADMRKTLSEEGLVPRGSLIMTK